MKKQFHGTLLFGLKPIMFTEAFVVLFREVPTFPVKNPKIPVDIPLLSGRELEKVLGPLERLFEHLAFGHLMP
jgi:hypothetical protein